jgi:hypothetical protein
MEHLFRDIITLEGKTNFSLAAVKAYSVQGKNFTC